MLLNNWYVWSHLINTACKDTVICELSQVLSVVVECEEISMYCNPLYCEKDNKTISFWIDMIQISTWFITTCYLLTWTSEMQLGFPILLIVSKTLHKEASFLSSSIGTLIAFSNAVWATSDSAFLVCLIASWNIKWLNV